jgi:predicted DCC family thiol-disulfide oxidoreductase YuxK
MQGWKLFYDGTCNLCHASMKRVRSWARARNFPLDVHTLQSPQAKEKGYSDQMVLEADGRVYVAGDAWLRVMAIAPWYLRWISWMRLTPMTGWIAKGFYSLIARTRFLWAGKRDPHAGCSMGGG